MKFKKIVTEYGDAKSLKVNTFNTMEQDEKNYREDMVLKFRGMLLMKL